MSFQVMLQQLTAGFGSTLVDLFSDFTFLTAVGDGSIFRKSKPVSSH